MKPDRFLPHSLKTRVMLLTLLIVVLSFLLLAYYSKNLLREELLLYTGQQQRSALNLMTAEVNVGLRDRFAALETLALRVAPKIQQDPSALQAFLLEQSFLAGAFNGGVRAWNRQGALQADVQFLSADLDAPALAPPELNRVLQDGQPVIGQMQVHDALKTVWFAMAVPVRSPLGDIVGALAGVVRLDQANFLSRLTSHRYGKTGHYFLVDARQRLIFAASDPMRLREVLPAPGVKPWIDRFMQGFEGTVRVQDSKNQDVLISVQEIVQPHWYAAITLPTEEAFSLIENINPSARLMGLVLLLLCLALIWLMLRRQLAPMTVALNTLDGFVRKNQAPQTLPVIRQDEVGQLVGGFNRLLDTLAQQQQVLRQNELLKQAVLNSVAAEIAVLDNEGVILEVNEAWRRNKAAGVGVAGQNGPKMDVGSNFLAACEGLKADAGVVDARSAQDGILNVLAGRQPRFYMEFASHLPQQQRWFSMSVTPLEGESRHAAVVSLEDISEHIQMTHQVRELAFYDQLTSLPNRRLAMERLTQHMVRARRTKSSLALLFIDLDEFKPINDELGHDVGDWLLCAVAQRIQACLRESDTAARLGGDEFVVLLPDLPNSASAMAVAEKIRQSLAQEYVTNQGMVLSITSSIGVALYPEHGATEKDLLRLGDQAMYQAKNGGRNAIRLCASRLSESGPEAERSAPQSYVHLRWKAAFNSGHAVIDQQHENLFLLANNLLDKAALRHQQAQAYETAYEALLNHIAAHFEYEETILREFGYVHLAQHAQLHQLLLIRAKSLYQQLQEAPEEAGAEAALTKFLVSELVAGHMLYADRDFFALFAQP